MFRDQFVDLQTLHAKQPVYVHSMLATSLPTRSLRSNKEIVCQSDRHRCKSFSLLCSDSLEQPLTVSHFICYVQETPRDISLGFGHPPYTAARPKARWCYGTALSNFAVEQRLQCCANEPEFARDVGTIEIQLIDWLIDIGYSRS